jgi:hypothetical protein
MHAALKDNLSPDNLAHQEVARPVSYFSKDWTIACCTDID